MDYGVLLVSCESLSSVGLPPAASEWQLTACRAAGTAFEAGWRPPAAANTVFIEYPGLLPRQLRPA